MGTKVASKSVPLLNEDSWGSIFDFLAADDLVEVEGVSRAFRRRSRQPELWRGLCLRWAEGSERVYDWAFHWQQHQRRHQRQLVKRKALASISSLLRKQGTARKEKSTARLARESSNSTPLEGYTPAVPNVTEGLPTLREMSANSDSAVEATSRLGLLQAAYDLLQGVSTSRLASAARNRFQRLKGRPASQFLYSESRFASVDEDDLVTPNKMGLLFSPRSPERRRTQPDLLKEVQREMNARKENCSCLLGVLSESAPAPRRQNIARDIPSITDYVDLFHTPIQRSSLSSTSESSGQSSSSWPSSSATPLPHRSSKIGLRKSADICPDELSMDWSLGTNDLQGIGWRSFYLRCLSTAQQTGGLTQLSSARVVWKISIKAVLSGTELGQCVTFGSSEKPTGIQLKAAMELKYDKRERNLVNVMSEVATNASTPRQASTTSSNVNVHELSNSGSMTGLEQHNDGNRTWQSNGSVVPADSETSAMNDSVDVNLKLHMPRESSDVEFFVRRLGPPGAPYGGYRVRVVAPNMHQTFVEKESRGKKNGSDEGLKSPSGHSTRISTLLSDRGGATSGRHTDRTSSGNSSSSGCSSREGRVVSSTALSLLTDCGSDPPSPRPPKRVRDICRRVWESTGTEWGWENLLSKREMLERYSVGGYIFVDVRWLQRENLIAFCVAKGICTFRATGPSHFIQPWYHCKTCRLDKSLDAHLGCCQSCAMICHAGHDVAFQRETFCYCDCGSAEMKQLMP